MCKRARSLRSSSWCLHPGLFVVDDPAEIRTGDGRAVHGVHPVSPRVVEARRRREPLYGRGRCRGCPRRVRTAGSRRWRSSASSQPARDPAAGGEHAGRARLDAFLADGVDHYHEQRDALAERGTSALSPYLHFGCLSAREVELGCRSRAGAAEFRRQLCWRDFYAQVLRSFPRNARSEHQDRVPGDRAGAARDAGSTPGARAGPAIRWSTPRCASCGARAGCTTAAA